MMFKKNCLSFFSCILLLACQPAGETKQLTKPFFDLKAYFEQETQRLAAVQSVKKTAEVDGQKEEKLMDTLNFQRELKIFSDNDLNRPAWSGKYQVDSIFNEKKELAKLNYTANDEDLKTRKMEIDFEQGAVAKIFIENGAANTISDTKQFLTYQPKLGYSIESHQKVVMGGEKKFLVTVQFQ